MLCGDQNGKEIQKRGDICICIADSLCCTVETNTILQSNYTPIKIFLKRHMHPNVQCSTIYNSQDMEAN